MGWEDRTAFEELFEFPLPDRERVNLIELLRAEPAVKFQFALEAVGPASRMYRIFTEGGDSRIERDELSGGLRYSVVAGPDPLGYSEHPASGGLMDGAFHDKDEWFEHTTGTAYPDGLFQITQLFDADRCGDIVTSSAPGWDFMNEDHHASHGGLEKDEMMVPCVVAGPGIREGETIPRARTVDLYPMYLEYFGVPALDGEVPNVFTG
jgi:hypothetical protein